LEKYGFHDRILPKKDELGGCTELKKVKCVIWILLCTLTVCACQNQERQSPTDTVDAFMKALSSMDGETLDSLYAAEEPLESMLDSETDKELVSAVFAKLQWEAGAQSIEEDLARVHLKITAAPYRKMVQAYETHVKENLESYRTKYGDMDDETYQAAILEDRLAFYQAYTETVTTEVDMDLVYQEDRWIISHCEGLSDALLGESGV